MTKQELYWAEREQANLLETLLDQDAMAQQLIDANTKAYTDNVNQLYAWYTKYGDANGITIEEARKAAEEADIKALAAKAKEYIATHDVSPEANAAMTEYNFAMKTSRLELLNNQIRWRHFELSDQEDRILKDLLPKTAVKALTRQAGIMGKTLYTPEETRKLGDYIAKSSYKGNTFSERIWTTDQSNMKEELDRTLRRGILQGKNPASQASQLAAIYKRKQSDAERLLRTEGARVRSHARSASFERAGYTHFKWIPRGTPCELCLEKVKLSEAEPFPIKDGDMPPLHPYCYCSTAPVEPEENILSKDAIDAQFEAEWQKALAGDAGAREHFSKLYQDTSTPDWKQFKLEDAAAEAKAARAAAAEADRLAAEAALAAKARTSIVQGKDLTGEIIELRRGQEPVEGMIAAQGFDGKPRVLSPLEFEKATKESGFYAQRSYSADSKATRDEYRRQLYEDKFYVDCGTGGAQYGQGMYCASTYDITSMKNTNGIQNEMEHYRDLGKYRGFKYAYTEELTLAPDAKIFRLSSGSPDGGEILDEYAGRLLLKTAETSVQREAATTYLAAFEAKRAELARVMDLEKATGKKYPRSKYLKIRNDFDDAEEIFGVTPKPKAYDARFYDFEFNDPGTLATEMGYDAIRAEGHGESGSYTVVLNRTKLIIKEGGASGYK